nr:hypothetical protein [Mesorhizobium sp.]
MTLDALADQLLDEPPASQIAPERKAQGAAVLAHDEVRPAIVIHIGHRKTVERAARGDLKCGLAAPRRRVAGDGKVEHSETACDRKLGRPPSTICDGAWPCPEIVAGGGNLADRMFLKAPR